MKVIFIKNLKGQGKVNEIKDVKDGYAINFLIKNGYAVSYTKGSVERLNREIEDSIKKENNDILNAKNIKQKLEKEKLEFIVKVGKDGRVFGSVSSKQIADLLISKGYEIDKKNINVITPINTLGIHIVKIKLHKKVEANLNIYLKEK